ncbi:MAG TPA: universal stress protein [Pyrinomonadaceae bacterium]|nr:universal stress protein [Pyrinomonadaceae bacterium]
MRILLAVDGSPCSELAVKEVARRPWPTGSEIKVISVMEMPVVPAMEPYGVSPDYFVELEEAARDRAQSAVDDARQKLEAREDKTLKVAGQVVEGSPKQAILDKADEWGADLIVVGSHGYGAITRFLLGSVSSAVVAHAKCSVEIVRSREQM